MFTGMCTVYDGVRDEMIYGVRKKGFPFTNLWLSPAFVLVELDAIQGPVNLVVDFASETTGHVYKLPLFS
jgi:hypothetical protein